MSVRFLGSVAFSDSPPPDRRQAATHGSPRRRSSDWCPAIERFHEAADRGEGVSTRAALARWRLS